MKPFARYRVQACFPRTTKRVYQPARCFYFYTLKGADQEFDKLVKEYENVQLYDWDFLTLEMHVS